jgi:hypothetical protein
MSGSNLGIKLHAVTLVGGNPTTTPCTGGTFFVSVVRTINPADPTEPPTVMPVTSDSDEFNQMTENGGQNNQGKYTYNLNIGDYPGGTYLITIWGNAIVPLTRTFTRPQ